MPAKKPLTYRDAGVDIDAGNELVNRIKPLVAATHRPGVLGNLGGFGGLFELDTGAYRQPVLVAGTDGVGTKLRLAIDLGRLDTVGIDLVAMCVNDVLVQGAEPLFFLDYYATGKLDVDAGAAVIAGVAEGCRQAGCALLGGETAEMPGMYAPGDLDLAGFCVGVVDRDRLLDGQAIQPGDQVLGLASTGPHSNGYSLIRRVLERAPDGADTRVDGSPVGELLLTPTRIYVPAVLAALMQHTVTGIAHVTGGGLAENLARVLPAGVDARIDPASWPRPPVFDWLQQTGQVPDAEMQRTFNCGIGLVLTAPAAQANELRDTLAAEGETVHLIGEIVAGSGQVRLAS
ncbi:MAG: phosphoribosylformylglycinamidine cyclo-ligase [Chromatiales bacterium]|nr:MAG: phosphoribosylformylglycinamidine cyclo-ligase [Chromatiales bacterium]